VSSQGGGEAKLPEGGRRVVNPADVSLPPGYRIEMVARDFTFPAGMTFDEQGTPHVVETGYSYGEVFATPRLLRVGPGGEKTVVVEGKNGPWTGVDFKDGHFFISEGGVSEGGRIVKYTKTGQRTVLAEGLPSLGDHHTNGPVVGNDGYVYFGQGTATNAGIVGPDNHEFGWLKRNPKFHDIPCKDVKLSGLNRETENPFDPDGPKVQTGAYVPFGTATEKGQVIPGQVPCSGAIMRVRVDGGPVELVAWGFRNPFGLAFAPNGQLYATDNGYDERGSRGVFGSADWLWAVKQDTWYGWPDFADGRPISMDRYEPFDGDSPGAVLAAIPNKPPQPAAFFGVHSSSDGMSFSTNPAFGHVGEAFVAQFGDQAAVVGKVLNPVGFKVVRVDVTTGVINHFAANAGTPSGPATKLQTGGLERPVDVQFDPTGAALYVVDFGTVLVDEDVVSSIKGSGVLWRIVRGS
jgi:glucose/arabinose dehydrogenase